MYCMHFTFSMYCTDKVKSTTLLLQLYSNQCFFHNKAMCQMQKQFYIFMPLKGKTKKMPESLLAWQNKRLKMYQIKYHLPKLKLSFNFSTLWKYDHQKFFALLFSVSLIYPVHFCRKTRTITQCACYSYWWVKRRWSKNNGKTKST